MSATAPQSPHQPGGGRATRRLGAGLAALDRWSVTADELDKFAAYRALFAVADGTVHAGYLVVQDPVWPQNYVVLVRPGLVLRIHAVDPDTFGLGYIGPAETAAGLDTIPDFDQSSPDAIRPYGDGA